MKFNAQTIVALVAIAIISFIFGYYFHARHTVSNPQAALAEAMTALQRECVLGGGRPVITARLVDVEGRLENVVDQVKCVEPDAFILQ